MTTSPHHLCFLMLPSVQPHTRTALLRQGVHYCNFFCRYSSKADAGRLLSPRYIATFASLLLALRAIQYLKLPASDISRVLTLQQPGVAGVVSLGWCLERVGQLVRVYRASKPAPAPDGEPDGAHGIVESVVLWCLGDDSRVSAPDVRVLLSDVWVQGRLPPRVFLRILTRVLAQV